jgi:hypothetical protein
VTALSVASNALQQIDKAASSISSAAVRLTDDLGTLLSPSLNSLNTQLIGPHN